MQKFLWYQSCPLCDHYADGIFLAGLQSVSDLHVDHRVKPWEVVCRENWLSIYEAWSVILPRVS